MGLLKLYEISFQVFFKVLFVKKKNTNNAILRHLCCLINISINIKDQARGKWPALMLVIKITFNIFLTSGYVCPPPASTSNKIFATLKRICRQIGNNYNETSHQRTPSGHQNSARYKGFHQIEVLPKLILLGGVKIQCNRPQSVGRHEKKSLMTVCQRKSCLYNNSDATGWRHA